MSDDVDRQMMARAVSLSLEHMQRGAGGPFGAVVARDGAILGEGWNQVTSGRDPTAHAEIVAIRRACQAVDSFSLKGATLYTSCEPCPMCLGAAYWARLSRIVYANTREDAAGSGFDDAWIYDEVPKEPGQRSLPMIHQPSAEARASFAAWDRKQDKVRY
jgi:tRNA(Arg) A34 adenosine deaminase TadA